MVSKYTQSPSSKLSGQPTDIHQNTVFPYYITLKKAIGKILGIL